MKSSFPDTLEIRSQEYCRAHWPKSYFCSRKSFRRTYHDFDTGKYQFSGPALLYPSRFQTKHSLFPHRPELIFDKNGIKLTSDPIGDESGVIELRVESGKYGQIVLIIENTSDDIITLKHITLLWSINFFDYSEISRIGPCEGQLFPGNLWVTLCSWISAV